MASSAKLIQRALTGSAEAFGRGVERYQGSCRRFARSGWTVSVIFAECAALAGESGAEVIELSCPSEMAQVEGKLDIIRRGFAYAWMRERR